MTRSYALEPDAAAAGQRLDSYLVAALPTQLAASRAQLQAWMVAGHVRVGGRVASKSQRVVAGERIEVAPPALRAATVQAVAVPLQVLFEDAHLLVVNKPAHLDVHPGAGEPRVTLVHALLAHCTDLSGIGGVQRPGIVHRLDRGTTGAIVVAKHDVAHRHLAAQFAARTVHKTYLALVHATGAMLANEPGAKGRIDTPYGRHRADRKRFSGAFVARGPQRRAVTDWQLLAKLSHQMPGADGRHARALALLTCTLHTGRTHQIRVHLAEMGCPIVADATYARGRPAPGTLPATLGLHPLDHQALHARRLSFVHPVRGDVVDIEAPLPSSWGPAVTHLLTPAGFVPPQSPEEFPCV